MEVQGGLSAKSLPSILCSLGFKSSEFFPLSSNVFKMVFSLLLKKHILFVSRKGERRERCIVVRRWGRCEPVRDDVLWFSCEVIIVKQETGLDRRYLFIVLTVQSVRGDTDTGRAALPLSR